MNSKFERLKRKMELQLNDEIFYLDDQAIFKYYGEFSARYFSGFNWLLGRQDYKINKNVFEEYNFYEIREILEEMSHVWAEGPYDDEPYEDEDDEKWCVEYDKRMANICLELEEPVKEKYQYYLELNKLYENILADDTECKTIPNKRYTQQKRCASC